MRKGERREKLAAVAIFSIDGHASFRYPSAAIFANGFLPMGFGWGLRAKAQRLASHIAATIPFGHMLRGPHGQVFASAYATQVWGSAESRSGQGSEREATTALRSYLPELFKRLDVKIFLDAPCGDWNWMQLVDLAGVDYIGIDVVADVIASNRERFARPGGGLLRCPRFA